MTKELSTALSKCCNGEVIVRGDCDDRQHRTCNAHHTMNSMNHVTTLEEVFI